MKYFSVQNIGLVPIVVAWLGFAYAIILSDRTITLLTLPLGALVLVANALKWKRFVLSLAVVVLNVVAAASPIDIRLSCGYDDSLYFVKAVNGETRDVYDAGTRREVGVNERHVGQYERLFWPPVESCFCISQ